MTGPSSQAVNAGSLVLYSHDTYGLGHLRRNLAIAAAALNARPDRQVVLVTGSPVADRFPRPAGLRVVTMPSVIKTGAESYQATDPAYSISEVRHARSQIIGDVLAAVRPETFLVDHSPAGMNGELLPVFGRLLQASPRTRVALGLRDILDEPGVVRRSWSATGIYDLLDRVYDDIFVYGCQHLFDVGRAYALPESVQSRLQYCGYIDKPRPPAPADAGARTTSTHPHILATAGGGGDGHDLLEATLASAVALGMAAVLVTGPLMRLADSAALAARCADTPGAQFHTFHPNLRAAMTQATVVVTMGGYNSLCEAVASGSPTVVVPRVHPRREQDVRARLFNACGLVHVAQPGSGLRRRLTAAIQTARSAPPATGRLDLGGLLRLITALDRPSTASNTSPHGELLGQPA